MKRAFSSLPFLLRILTFEFWVLNAVLVYGEDTHVPTTAALEINHVRGWEVYCLWEKGKGRSVFACASNPNPNVLFRRGGAFLALKPNYDEMITPSTNETMKDPICPTCNHESCDWGECYKNYVIFTCLPSFEKILTDYNNLERCTWDTIKRSYTEFTMCTELYADTLRVPWPNQLVQDTFVRIHAKYFQDCQVNELYDPPPSIIFVLVMTPICLIPVMVTLVVLKTKNGDSTS